LGLEGGGGGVVFCFCSLFNLCPFISLDPKWWPTVLETKNTCSQWVGWSMHSRCLDSVHFSFVPNMFPLCSFKFPTGSHQIHHMFPKFSMCSPRVFPIASGFNPICFAQSPPLLTYIAGWKDRHSVFSNRLFWEILHSFNSFWRRVNQNNSLQKKKSWSCESPPN
jgi:hypothetical protein